jgi:hypothetical protein
LWATASFNELRSAVMLGHHAFTFMLAYLCVMGPYGHYYIAFFFGLVEVSNLPLTAIEVLGYFPAVKARFPMIKTLNEYLFVLLFFFFRVFCWPVIGYEFIVGNLTLLAQPAVLRSAEAVYFYILGISGLTGLQIMWAWKIIELLVFPEKQKERNH